MWLGQGGCTALDEIGIGGLQIIDLEHNDSTIAFLHGCGLGSADRGGKKVGFEQEQAYVASISFRVYVVLISKDRGKAHNFVLEVKGCREIVDEQAEIVQFHSPLLWFLVSASFRYLPRNDQPVGLKSLDQMRRQRQEIDGEITARHQIQYDQQEEWLVGSLKTSKREPVGGATIGMQVSKSHKILI